MSWNKAILDIKTGQITYEAMNAEEIADHKKVVAEAAEAEAKRVANEEAKADAKLATQAKLQALGLTGEEISAITE